MTRNTSIKHVGILFSGGPAPAANAVISAAALSFINAGVSVVGFFGGYENLQRYSADNPLVEGRDYQCQSRTNQGLCDYHTHRADVLEEKVREKLGGSDLESSGAFRQAARQDPQYLEAQYWTGRMYYFMDRYEHARRSYERFVYMDATHPRVGDALKEYLHTYEKLADTWKPKPRPAREWAQIAKAAGMKYMVMTTKHHEGFCLWDTEQTDYNAVKHGPGRARSGHS